MPRLGTRTPALAPDPDLPGAAGAAVALAAALSVHGAASLPAPDALGSAELAVAGLLVLAVGPRRLARLAAGRTLVATDASRFEQDATLALVVLATVPLARGLARGWWAGDAVRDLVSLGFLFLPLALAPLADRPAVRAFARPALTLGLAGAGVAFALRWWTEAGWRFGTIGTAPMDDGEGYLLNSPAVLFAALWLPVAAAGLVAGAAPASAGGARGVGRLCVAGAAALGGVLCLAALVAAVHRAALAFSAVAIGLWAVGALVRRSPDRPGCDPRPSGPATAAPVIIASAAAIAALLGLVLTVELPLPGALAQMVDKTRQVGTNARTAEWGAVLAAIGRDPITLAIGDGWGALLNNPAVGGLAVSYTHNLVAYMLLKAGLVGVLVTVGYLSWWSAPMSRLAATAPGLAIAAGVPLANGLVAHTSFKFLTFGLLLCLVRVAGAPPPAAKP